MGLPSTKRRRLILKQERAISQGAMEALEGASYQTGIGHEEEVDIEMLPEAVPKGNFNPVILSGDPTIITFDLETTGLIQGRQHPQITQIAAVNIKSGITFDKYVMPTIPIGDEAQRVTGISVSGNTMTARGETVQASTIIETIDKFCDWLDTSKNVILVAHNGRRFDFPILIEVFAKLGKLDRLFKCVAGCVDSLSVLRFRYPGRSSYKQEDLVHAILNVSYGAHNAIEDVRALGLLIQQAALTFSKFLSFSFSPKAVLLQQRYNMEKAKNLPSLSVLVANGICKGSTAENIASSGLNMDHLRLIYSRSGEDGLQNTFIGKNKEGQPRVTNAKRVLESVIPKLVDFIKKM